MPRRRRRSPGFEAWIGTSSLPIFVLDAKRQVVAFNTGCERLTGWGAAEIIGTVCHYGSAPESAGAAALAAGLCPPPEVFAGQALETPAYLIAKDGHPIPRLLQFVPLRDEKERVAGVLGFARPLPEPTPRSDQSPSRLLHAELAALRAAMRARYGLSALVARSVAMRKVLAQVELAQQTSAFVLLVGESGTGKEHLARAIHLSSPQRGQWFVPLDCRRLGADELERVWHRLLEPHRTTSTPSAGAQPGTVYLSDVEFLPREMQERLTKLFEAGVDQPAPTLRLISSTSGDLEQAVNQQKLRGDFAALISPLTIALPPLRERSDDLPLLAQYFLEELNRQEEKQLGGLDEAVWPLLLRYAWPGNLDELLAVLQEARERAADPLIRVQDLPFRFRNALEAQLLPPPASAGDLDLDKGLAQVETRLIELALSRSKQNRSKAAELLKVPRARLLRRIEQLGLGGDRPPEDPSASLVELTEELLQPEPEEA